ncbi:MAG: hypothetical protein Crog4KO_04010 [Crocinitomicaceae bacterium]
MKLLVFLSLTLFFNDDIFAQEPPPAAVAEEGNKVLIDTLVELSRYDLLYEQIEENIISAYQQKYGWDQTMVDSLKSNLSFDSYGRQSRMYNAHVRYTREELEEKIIFYRSLSETEVIAEFPNLERMVVSNFKNEIEWACKKALKVE